MFNFSIRIFKGEGERMRKILVHFARYFQDLTKYYPPPFSNFSYIRPCFVFSYSWNTALNKIGQYRWKVFLVIKSLAISILSLKSIAKSWKNFGALCTLILWLTQILPSNPSLPSRTFPISAPASFIHDHEILPWVRLINIHNCRWKVIFTH